MVKSIPKAKFLAIVIMICVLLVSICTGCGNSQEKAELERARLALEKERLALEKTKEEHAEAKRVEATRPWWEKELAQLKGSGKPITSSFKLAIKKGDAVDVKNHIDYGENVNRRFKRGGQGYYTPLFFAALKGHTLVAALLIQEGADPSSRATQIGIGNVYYAYPIHVAIEGEKADADFIRLLLDRGANVNQKCGKGLCRNCTPLELISQMKNDHPYAVEIVKVLREYGGRY